MPEEFIAVILEDNRITIPKLVAKIKRVKKGKVFKFAIIKEIE